jgi:hypothetical protein
MSGQDRCPHCRASVGVVPARQGGLRCRICGGPRVVIRDRRMVLGGNEVAHLVEARQRRRVAWLWLGLALLSGAIGSIFLLLVTIGLLVFSASTLTSAIFLLLGSIPWVAAFLAWRRRRRALAAGNEALRRAQLSAARDVLGGARRDLTAQDIARYLELPLPQTEQLLTELNVDDSIVSEVTDAGEVTYRLAPLRLRVDESFGPTRVAPDTDLDEIHDDLDAHEQDEEAARLRAQRAQDDGANR